MTTAQEKQHLLSLYEGCTAYHGELHDHSASGGTSDGKCTLSEWTARLAELKMDFAAILDHRQVRHMYLPEWKDGLFIPGTEPGTKIDDCAARIPHMHYNILLPERGELEKLLAEFPEYEFTGGSVGVRMCMGDTLSGGHCAFAGQRLALCIDDFHPSVADPAHEYRLDLLNENGLVLSRSLRCTQANWLAIDAQDCAFYRAEVVDLTRGLRIAVGNPIWNDR